MAAVVLVWLAGCRSGKERFEVVASRIQYDVPIASADPQLDWWVNNLEGSRREPFVKRILEAAKSGEVKAYDYFNEPLTAEDVRNMASDTLIQTLVRNAPPYDSYDTMVINTMNYEDVVKIRFLEEWSWDPKTMEFRKTVVGICPLASISIGKESYNRPLFWIYLDDRYPLSK